MAHELAAIHDNLPLREGVRGFARKRHAFKDGEADGQVLVCRLYNVLRLGVEDHEVSVEAHADCAFVGQAVDARGRSGNQFH